MPDTDAKLLSHRHTAGPDTYGHTHRHGPAHHPTLAEPDGHTFADGLARVVAERNANRIRNGLAGPVRPVGGPVR